MCTMLSAFVPVKACSLNNTNHPPALMTPLREVMPGREESTKEKQVPLLSIMSTVPKCEDNGCCANAPNIPNCPCRNVLTYHTQPLIGEITKAICIILKSCICIILYSQALKRNWFVKNDASINQRQQLEGFCMR